ncbi:MAG: hypothetical protein LBN94_00935, partial [Puniceicoccales bacterium]|nr:hypothetical protein [Puniceicoccales bacterium]
PRDGWDPLPFEKFIATEKVLQKLPEPIEIEKVKEIHLEEVFDRAAEAQILAIQQRLSAALESVKKATQERQEEMRLPSLPTFVKREPSIEVASLAQLPDQDGKRSISVDLEQHYAKELKIIVPEEDTLKQAIRENGFSSKDKMATADALPQGETNLSHGNPTPDGKVSTTEENVVRNVESITEDIEKMISKGEDRPLAPTVSRGEEIPSAIADPKTQKVRKKLPSIRPSRGIVISALKSKIQQNDDKNPSAIRENVDSQGDQRNGDLIQELFAGMTGPKLPSSENVSSEEEGRNTENNEKVMAMQRQSKTRRFYL